MLSPISASPPTGLAASNVDANTATLTWDSINGATYDYRYRQVGTSTWNTFNTSNTSENISGLNPGTQYEAQVRSNCNSNTSAYSSTVNFTTSNTVILHEGYFETGLDGWTDGGSDCERVTGSF